MLNARETDEPVLVSVDSIPVGGFPDNLVKLPEIRRNVLQERHDNGSQFIIAKLNREHKKEVIVRSSG